MYMRLLDCSKAFDKVKHDVLLKKLYDKGRSPLTVRIIMNMYLHGSAQVRWIAQHRIVLMLAMA